MVNFQLQGPMCVIVGGSGGVEDHALAGGSADPQVSWMWMCKISLTDLFNESFKKQSHQMDVNVIVNAVYSVVYIHCHLHRMKYNFRCICFSENLCMLSQFCQVPMCIKPQSGFHVLCFNHCVFRTNS